jgi:hypothetical protein
MGSRREPRPLLLPALLVNQGFERPAATRAIRLVLRCPTALLVDDDYFASSYSSRRLSIAAAPSGVA